MGYYQEAGRVIPLRNQDTKPDETIRTVNPIHHQIRMRCRVRKGVYAFLANDLVRQPEE